MEDNILTEEERMWFELAGAYDEGEAEREAYEQKETEWKEEKHNI